MNKFKFYFILLVTTVSIFSCSKSNDDYTVEPPRDYQTQYNTDIATIEKYLNSNYFVVTNKPGESTDQDITIEKITDPTSPTQRSIMSYLNSDTLPTLKLKIVEQNGISYKLYYLVLREGIGESPCSVDGVFAAYKGTYLYETAATATPPSEITNVTFEDVPHPYTTLSLFQTIAGWGEVFPEFKKGTHTPVSSNGTISYNDFGAGVMFLPSALAYYNQTQSTIPAYSPLVFSFKLYDIQRLDQDADGIPSYLEDLNKDNYLRVLASGIDNPDDTDKDGIPDFLDVDDDGDNYTTSLEIKNPATGVAYPFDLIPTCTTGTETKKNYLTPTCHP